MALGLRQSDKLVKLWEVNGQFGGPIMRDRLWFFATGRHLGTKNKVAGIFINKNAGDLSKWTYDPDYNQQAVADNTTKKRKHPSDVAGFLPQQGAGLVGRAGHLPAMHRRRRGGRVTVDGRVADGGGG